MGLESHKQRYTSWCTAVCCRSYLEFTVRNSIAANIRSVCC